VAGTSPRLPESPGSVDNAIIAPPRSKSPEVRSASPMATAPVGSPDATERNLTRMQNASAITSLASRQAVTSSVSIWARPTVSSPTSTPPPLTAHCRPWRFRS
jgi:hypothetical protein